MKKIERTHFFIKGLLTLILLNLLLGNTLAAEGLPSIREDLSALDETLFGESQAVIQDPSQAILGKTSIQARVIYQGYLERAVGVTDELMLLREVLNQQGGQLSLQRLGAFTQALKRENHLFKDTFTHGETEFTSYQLIQTAVSRLEDALNYWRQANRYRRGYRGSVLAREEDDEVLKIKLQQARQAIEELHVITEARKALERDIEFNY